MNLLLLLPEDPRSGARFTIRGARAEHLISVLGVEPGRSLHVGLLDGPQGTAVVERVDSNSVQLDARFDGVSPGRSGRRLILAVPRPKVLRRLLPQIASLGVEELVLLRSWRVRRSHLEADILNPQVYRPLLHDGLMQACLTFEPRVRFEARFRPYVEDRLPAELEEGHAIVAHPRAERSLAELSFQPERPLTLVLGPEAGFLDAEVESLQKAGAAPARLAGSILKVETACVSGLAQVELALEFSRRRKGRTVPPACP